MRVDRAMGLAASSVIATTAAAWDLCENRNLALGKSYRMSLEHAEERWQRKKLQIAWHCGNPKELVS